MIETVVIRGLHRRDAAGVRDAARVRGNSLMWQAWDAAQEN